MWHVSATEWPILKAKKKYLALIKKKKTDLLALLCTLVLAFLLAFKHCFLAYEMSLKKYLTKSLKKIFFKVSLKDFIGNSFDICLFHSFILKKLFFASRTFSFSFHLTRVFHLFTKAWVFCFCPCEQSGFNKSTLPVSGWSGHTQHAVLSHCVSAFNTINLQNML